MVFVLSTFVSHLPFFRCLGKAVFRDCGILWVSSHIFFLFRLNMCHKYIHIGQQVYTRHNYFKYIII